MARTPHKEKWYAGMRKKLGVKTNTEVRAYMKKVGMKGKKTGTGGFAHMAENNPDRLKDISRKAALTRHGKEVTTSKSQA